MEIGQIKSIKIKNIKLLKDVEININRAINIFWGNTNQGKTSILQVFDWLFTQGFPQDIITYGKSEAMIHLIFENGFISRSFYMDKNNKTKGRKLNCFFDNEQYSFADLKKYISPLAINQSHFKNLNGAERERFFLEVLDVDTKDIDNKIKQFESVLKDLEMTIKSFGDFNLEEVKEPNKKAIEQAFYQERQRLNELYLIDKKENEKLKEDAKIKYKKEVQKYEISKSKLSVEIVKFNREQEKIRENNKIIIGKKSELEQLKTSIFADAIDFNKLDFIVNNLENPKKLLNFDEVLKERNIVFPEFKEPEYYYKNYPENADTTKLNELQEKMNNLKVEQLKYANYLKELAKFEDKKAYKKELNETKELIKELKKDKIKKLSEYTNKIENITFDIETGKPKFFNSLLENLSDSLLIRLNSILVNLIPKNRLKVMLIDRGESLNLENRNNLSVYLRMAEENNSIILLTVVSNETPIIASKSVDLFNVEKGKIKK